MPARALFVISAKPRLRHSRNLLSGISAQIDPTMVHGDSRLKDCGNGGVGENRGNGGVGKTAGMTNGWLQEWRLICGDDK